MHGTPAGQLIARAEQRSEPPLRKTSSIGPVPWRLLRRDDISNCSSGRTAWRAGSCGMIPRMTGKSLVPLRVAISVLAVAGLVVRVIWPDLRLDAISLGLLIVAVLPWVSDLFESLEFPGGWKVNFRDVTKAAAAIPQPADPAKTTEIQPSYLAVRDLDPSLGLVGLRIEIERRLQALAEAGGIDNRKRSAGVLARSLAQKGILPPDIAGALVEIIGAGNAAAHGAEVPSGLHTFAFDEGPRILAWLDEQSDVS